MEQLLYIILFGCLIGAGIYFGMKQTKKRKATGSAKKPTLKKNLK